MSNWVIDAQNLSKTYQEGRLQTTVLQDASLQVGASQRIAIIGQSGAGKSTLLHLLGGLDQPTAGHVALLGQPFSQCSANQRAKLRNQHLGFVYQFHHLLPEFTALENVAMPLLIGKASLAEAKHKAQIMLDKVGLTKRLQHKPSELSGGERQRVAIARALVTEPACLLADEPTGNLDSKTAQSVYDVMLDVQQSVKTSWVLVTHDERLAQRMDTVLHMQDGHLE